MGEALRYWVLYKIYSTYIFLTLQFVYKASEIELSLYPIVATNLKHQLMAWQGLAILVLNSHKDLLSISYSSILRECPINWLTIYKYMNHGNIHLLRFWASLRLPRTPRAWAGGGGGGLPHSWSH